MAAANLSLVTGAPERFCTGCGKELPEPGALCPACPQVDARRRAVISSYRGQLEALRDIDAAEHAAELLARAQSARAEYSRAEDGTGQLEAAAKSALAAERRAADRARASADHAGKMAAAERRTRRDVASPEARTNALALRLA